MSSFITVAAATLPSVPLDFAGNRDRILESIAIAKARGATLRVGPELEITGYGCLDHFQESDTVHHSWQVLAEILASPLLEGMIVDVGMPVRHRNVQYNTRVVCTYKRIFFIRPKQSLANDGLYREARHFTAWTKQQVTETYYLEQEVREVTGQQECPIGDCVLSTLDTAVGVELCEEMWTPDNPSTRLGLNGVEIFTNSSASHAELRKLSQRLELIRNTTRKLGGVYIYCNATGVDGEARQMFDGSSMILLNGEVLAQSPQFSLEEVNVITATVSIERVRSFRSSASRNIQAAAQSDFQRVEANLRLGRPIEDLLRKRLSISEEIELKISPPMEEIYLSTAVWLWQYLIRTRSGGYFLPLSGGADSCSTALMVYGMAKLVLESVRNGNRKVLQDLRMITGDEHFTPETPQDIVSRLFHTAYMGTKNSGSETRTRAKELAESIGAFHSDMKVDPVIEGLETVLQQTLGFKAEYSVHGGTPAENLALQNIQARSRMVVAYMMAQLSTTARPNSRRKGASLLVLGSGNLDEILRGYLTKYDCSSADISPLGSISKTDVRAFIHWAMATWSMPALKAFIDATPSAELTPLGDTVQSDEVEMGMTYEELSVFGKLRKVERLGPYSCYIRLLSLWKDKKGCNTPQQIADKTMHFHRYYAINRHKSTVMTPSVHLSAYNVDDNRFDLRPFLILPSWPFQFAQIKAHVEKMNGLLAETRENGDID